jgi:hypothetical protein
MSSITETWVGPDTGGDSPVKRSGMLVVSLRSVKLGKKNKGILTCVDTNDNIERKRMLTILT